MLIHSSRYNLKRRVASLPPLSSEYFTEKVLTAKATSSAAAAKASFEKSCSACQKTYYSDNAYQNHLKSQKHRLRIAALQSGNKVVRGDTMSSLSSSTFTLGEPINADIEFAELIGGVADCASNGPESVSRPASNNRHHPTQIGVAEENRTDVPQKDPVPTGSESLANKSDVPLNRCMFCNYESPTFKLGIMHMNKFHGMFIPEQQYLVDLEGLIRYLYSKIMENHECLYCHKLKNSMSSIQTHMRDKGHCMIAFETEDEMIEVGQFYDFSSTYSDDEDDDMIDELEHNNDETGGGVGLDSNQSKALKTVICTSNGDEEIQDGKVDNEGWETDSSASSLDSEDLTAIPIDRNHALERLNKRAHYSDGIHSHSHAHHHRAVFHSDYELYLPSGRTAGHRSLARYFRQNLHSYPTPSERMENLLIEDANPREHFDDQRGRQITTRANGGLGMIGATDAKKQEARAIEKRERKREHRAQDQHQWAVDKRGNSQKHFRDPLLQ